MKTYTSPNQGYWTRGIELYWFETCNTALCGAIATLLDKEPGLKKSQPLADFFTELALQEKWRKSRADFIYVLMNMRNKPAIIKIADHPSIWHTDGFTQFNPVEAIHKLKIPRACWHSTFEADFASENGRCKAKTRANAVHWRVFATRQMPFYDGKASKTLSVNTP